MRKGIILGKVVLGFLLFSCGGGNVFESMADKSSPEACKNEVSKNLDTGNWDAVLSSSCADNLQRGAAYLGKAGFDIKDIINRLVENRGNTQDFKVYLNALVPRVEENTLVYLERAKAEYGNVPASDPLRRDAEFYMSLVDSAYALSVFKTVITGGGETISQCDINNNGVLDEADATACALSVSGSGLTGPCVIGTYTTTSDITFTGKSRTYRGITIDLGTPTSSCTDIYKKVFYKSGTIYYLATTVGTCTGSDGNDWPCPIEEDNQPKDFVDTIQNVLNSAVDVIKRLLPPGSDVKDAIEKIRSEACGSDSVCTADEIRNYINTKLTK